MLTGNTTHTLKSFVSKDKTVLTHTVQVIARNSPHKGRNITVFTVQAIETLICVYASAVANSALRQNQLHIGRRCIALMKALMHTVLEVAIKEACGLRPQIQKTMQKNFVDAVAIIQENGFVGSVQGNLATKKDIATFLQVPISTVASFLRKYKDRIAAIPLSKQQISSVSSRASRMFAYQLEDVAKIVFAMDTAKGLELKRQAFGEIGAFASFQSKEETQWRELLESMLAGFDLHTNYQIGKYRVDFYAEKLNLVLECNGYAHRYYDPVKEAQREQYILEKGFALVRFHHQVKPDVLVNGILHAKPGQSIHLYDEKCLRTK